MSYNWSFDDLALVLDFYMQHGLPRKANEQVFSELARLALPHPAGSVKAQIRNFAALAEKGRFDHWSSNAAFVWETFKDDPEGLRREAHKITTNRKTWHSTNEGHP